jgi:hypothetical protein
VPVDGAGQLGALLQLLVCPVPGDLLRLPPGRRHLVQNQRPDTVRIGGGERYGDKATVAGGEDRRALRSCLVEDGPEIVDERLDRWDISGCEPLRAAEAAPVGDDQARETSQGVREARERRMLLIQDDVGELALEVDEVDGSRPDDLEREAIIAVPCIARLRPFHAHMVAHDPVGGKLRVVFRRARSVQYLLVWKPFNIDRYSFSSD